MCGTGPLGILAHGDGATAELGNAARTGNNVVQVPATGAVEHQGTGVFHRRIAQMFSHGRGKLRSTINVKGSGKLAVVTGQHHIAVGQFDTAVIADGVVQYACGIA